MHFPDQVSPLEADVMFAAREAGARAAIERYRLPAVTIHTERVNTFVYEGIELIEVPDDKLAELVAMADDELLRTGLRLGDLWRMELLPEVVEHLDAMAHPDLGDRSTQELVDALEAAVDRHNRLGEIHHLAVIPAYVVLGEFEETCWSLFPDEDPFLAWDLLAGRPTKTLDAGTGLSRLGREAREEPAVLGALASAPDRAEKALEAFDAGRRFLRSLRAYLDSYGELGDKWGIGHASWIEDPAPLLRAIAASAREEAAAPEGRRDAVARRRDEALARIRRRLDGYPSAARESFESLLAAAREAIAVSEDHSYYIDFCAAARLRRVILELGRRLQADGSIESAEDAFLLEVAELIAAGRRSPGSAPREIAAAREDEMRRYSATEPPPLLGGSKARALPAGALSRFLVKFYGIAALEPQVDGVLRGTGGSPGRATGVARVIDSIAESDRLGSGEVLVTATIAPPWTSLFSRAAAVVTDTGGVLSHGAIVAREYGLPAVVAAGAATKLIADGQRVEVDGTAGTVRPL